MRQLLVLRAVLAALLLSCERWLATCVGATLAGLCTASRVHSITSSSPAPGELEQAVGTGPGRKRDVCRQPAHS